MSTSPTPDASSKARAGAVTEAWCEGDVFRWSYKDEGPEDRSPYRRYHCCSMIGIVAANGRMYDTYWSTRSQDDRSFGPDDRERLKLTYLGNMNDFDRRSEGERDYYDDADIMDLNHSNSSRNNFYIRKGAKRSRKKMLAYARERLKKAESDERWARERAQRHRETIARIQAGEIENVYL